MINSTFVSDCAANLGVQTFPTNPDITGIGVRISLYASTLLGLVVNWYIPQDLVGYRDAARTALVTSTAMIIAAIYARYTSLGLSLIDAEIVTLFVTIVAFYYYGLTRYDLGLTTRVAARTHLILACIFGFLVYSDVDHFGGAAYLPQCAGNDEFVFVAVGTVSATNSGLRIFALVVYSLLLAGFVYLQWRRFLFACVRSIALLWSAGVLGGLVAIAQEISRGTLGGNERKFAVASSKPALPGLALLVYLVSAVEVTIHKNNLASLNTVDQWTFGQTVAVIMVLDQLIKGFQRIREEMARRRAEWLERRLTEEHGRAGEVRQQ